ncbi:MAG: hypothetical protein KGI33_12445 [Thaumarchaeota archaeon]|nr:hypothetical protein [Nitrososphaerota archaeon]
MPDTHSKNSYAENMSILSCGHQSVFPANGRLVNGLADKGHAGKRELIDRRLAVRTKDEAKEDIFDYIDMSYSQERNLNSFRTHFPIDLHTVFNPIFWKRLQLAPAGDYYKIC